LDYETGIGDSLVYAIVYGSLGQIIARYWFTLLGIHLGILEADVIANTSRFAAQALFTPVILIISLLLGAGVIHMALWILGGASRSYGATFQVLSYVLGAVSLVSVIPLVGSVLMPLWGLCLNCIGLAGAHRTSRMRVFFAIMLPLFFGAFLLAFLLLLAATLGVLGFMETVQQRI
jgi:hypothetical protein